MKTKAKPKYTATLITQTSNGVCYFKVKSSRSKEEYSVATKIDFKCTCRHHSIKKDSLKIPCKVVAAAIRKQLRLGI